MNHAPSEPMPSVGDVLEFEIEGIAHGGHCLAHAEGFTFFIRGALPGELVRATVTHKRKGIYFANTVEVISPSTHRVTPPCSAARECGGCDFQFADVPFQRELKTTVLKDSLRKFSGLTATAIDSLVGDGVMSLGGDQEDGVNWRTRARFVWAGGWKMRRFRGDATVDTPDCAIATENMRQAMSAFHPERAGEYLIADGDSGVGDSGVGDSGVSVLGPDGFTHGPTKVTHEVFGSQWRVSPAIFWQAHEALLPAIGEFLDVSVEVNPGETWWDLFGGCGVFAAYMSARVGEAGLIYSVEADHHATQTGKRALHDKPEITFVHADVSEFIASSVLGGGHAPQGVLLDPPRAGAGIDLCESLKKLSPRSIIYIACDPVSLSRDLKVLSDAYHVTHLRSWDAFPMSHHFETVAVLQSHLS